MQKSTQYIVVGALLVAITVVAGIGAYRAGWIDMSLFSKGSPSAEALIERPINFPPDFTPEARELFNTNLAELKRQLAEDPKKASAWFDLAIYYRMIRDTEGAVAVWEHIIALYPTDGVAYHNLGEYYLHDEKDYPRSETYYLKSIELNPQLSANYSDLFDMYKDVYKTDTQAATDILKKGIANVPSPGSVDLKIMLARYLAQKGDRQQALVYYKDARTDAQRLGNFSLIKALDREIANLK